jgi:hypothetical protein
MYAFAVVALHTRQHPASANTALGNGILLVSEEVGREMAARSARVRNAAEKKPTLM